jgi:excisionase family DNA binding protein
METDISNIYNISNLLKAEEVAQILNVSRSYAYFLMKSGQLPSVRLGRSVRVNPQDLEEYITLNTFRGFGLN